MEVKGDYRKRDVWICFDVVSPENKKLAGTLSTELLDIQVFPLTKETLDFCTDIARKTTLQREDQAVGLTISNFLILDDRSEDTRGDVLVTYWSKNVSDHEITLEKIEPVDQSLSQVFESVPLGKRYGISRDTIGHLLDIRGVTGIRNMIVVNKIKKVRQNPLLPDGTS